MSEMIKNLSKDPQFARFGALAQEFCNVKLPLQVLKSAAGHYIGTFGESGPVSRESQEYWAERSAADEALKTGNWTQKENP